jgi:hypothetical protein
MSESLKNMEKIVGCLAGVSGHTYDIIYDLLFTTERIIALIVQHPADVPYKFGVTDLLFGGLSARRGRRFDRKPSAEERLGTYQGKTMEELLTGHAFNFEIPYKTVRAVEITRGWRHRRLKFHLDIPPIPGRIIQFTLAEDQVSQARDLLKSALPLKSKEE